MKRKDIKTKIRDFFLQNPTLRLRVRQIEREVKVPLPSAIKYTHELEKENLLKSTTIAEVKLYQADRTSNEFKLEKKIYNLRHLYHSGVLDFLIQELNNPVIVLFGSYAHGEDTESSDIDLYLETPSSKEINLSRFEDNLQRKIQLFKYKKLSFIKNKELANNIINGITLNGFIEVF